MYTQEALLDIHERTHRSFAKLLAHCAHLSAEELHRTLEGFGFPTVQWQFDHTIGAEEYWIGVLCGEMRDEDTRALTTTIAKLEEYRAKVYAFTRDYLHGATAEELSTRRRMITWGGTERELVPAQVVMRTVTHVYHHQGQILAMCRLLGKPGERMDYPLD